MLRHYEPEIVFPPKGRYAKYGNKEMFAAMSAKYAEKAPAISRKSGIRRENKNGFTFNVVQFVPQGGADGGNLKTLTQLTRGQFEQIKGLDEIRSVSEAGRDQ